MHKIIKFLKYNPLLKCLHHVHGAWGQRRLFGIDIITLCLVTEGHTD